MTIKPIALLFAAATTVFPAVAHAQANEPTSREVRFFSEAVSMYGKVFVPGGFSASGSAPAVILAPGWGETAASLEKYAARFAAKGLVAMTIDYRGWGKSGGFIYLADATRWDDRLRFSQHTSKVRIRRKRLLPEAQLIDIRNAITSCRENRASTPRALASGESACREGTSWPWRRPMHGSRRASP